MRASGSLRRQVPADAAASQLGKAGRPAFPLLPGDGAQPSPGPLVKLTQHRRGLAEAEVAAPSAEVDGQLLDDLREAFASGTARQLPHSGGASDGVLVSLQRATSLCDRGIEIVDGCEMSIDERLVDEGPKVLCRLQLRAVGGLEDQPDAVGNGEVFRTVPAGLVEYDNDDALAAGTGLPCEGFEQFGKERLVDAVRQIPDG